MGEYTTVDGKREKTTDLMLEDRLKLMLELAFVTLERDNALADLKKAREELMDVVEGRI